jgi:membrane-bound lytic murein transglycosylase D
MTLSHRYSVSAVVLLAAFLYASAGCAPARSQQFRTSFLPPAPRAAEDSDADATINEPAIDSDYFVHETPNLVPVAALPPRIPAVDDRLQRAQDRFDAGKRAYQQGRFQDARREFNRAIDILLGAPEEAPDRSRLERRLDQMVDAIYRYDVNGLGAAEDADQVVYDKSPLDGILEMTFPIDPRLKPRVKEEIAATASQLPLEENDSVVSYIHFFSTPRGLKILTTGLQRSGRYQPLIHRILAEEGVPQELIFLAQIESGFLPRAVSNRKAVGMWQFVKWRGREYGLTQTRTTDDRLDPEKATRAAARHLRDLYDQFGDWYLALAAYNCGPGCVGRAVERTGYADFWKLRELNALPKETQNYVPAILAVTIMAKNAKDYGVDDVDADAPLEYDTLTLDATTNLALVADALEVPVSEIRALNPSLLRGSAPAGYELRVPKGGAARLAVALANVPLERRASARIHRVEHGETLEDIARRYHAAASAISAANDNLIEAPEAGEVLIIPTAYREKSEAVTRGKSKPSGAKAKATSRSRRRTTKASAAHTRRVPSTVLHRRAQAPRIQTAKVSN